MSENKETIYDDSNRIIGFTDKQSNGEIIVYSSANQYLGKVTADGTYNAANIRISTSKLPGLLISNY